MSDFLQNGLIANLSLLNKNNLDDIETQLIKLKEDRKIALVLPSLYSEVGTKALKNILETLREVQYIDQIVVTLGKATATEFKDAKKFFNTLPQQPTIIWNDGPNLQRLYKKLNKYELSAGPDGKGRSVWMAIGYTLALNKAYMICIHDCDILTYNRNLLARLCFPIASPSLLYEYCKGYYARFTDRLHGRVTRLLLNPIIKALITIIGNIEFLQYLKSFRYILAGEFALISELAQVIRIQSDWGLEIGILNEIYHNCSLDRICQVELTENYEHKHQPLFAKDPKKGLLKMAIDIIKTLLQNLASLGIIISADLVKTLKIAYNTEAKKESKKFEDLSKINSLTYDRHTEGICIETFMKAIDYAYEEYNKASSPVFIPSWIRISYAIPEFFNELLEAVELDNK